jgi:uncharacterized protein HemY
MTNLKDVVVLLLALAMSIAIVAFLGANAGTKVYLTTFYWQGEMELWKVIALSYFLGAITFMVFYLILGVLSSPEKKRMKAEMNRMRKELDKLRNMPLDATTTNKLENQLSDFGTNKTS